MRMVRMCTISLVVRVGDVSEGPRGAQVAFAGTGEMDVCSARDCFRLPQSAMSPDMPASILPCASVWCARVEAFGMGYFFLELFCRKHSAHPPILHCACNVAMRIGRGLAQWRRAVWVSRWFGMVYAYSARAPQSHMYCACATVSYSLVEAFGVGYFILAISSWRCLL